MIARLLLSGPGALLLISALHAQPGSLDPGFNTTGYATFGDGANGATMVAVRPDGTVLLGGQGVDSPFLAYEAVSFTAAGAPDLTFGSGGMALISFNANDERPFAMELQPDGKLVQVGTVRASASSAIHFGIVRFNADGSPDDGFGTAGKVDLPIGAVNAKAYAVALRSDQRILVAGSYGSSTTDFAIACLNTDGTLYSGFGTGGITTIDLATYDQLKDIAVRSDGSILLTGACTNTDYQFGVAALHADGTPDLSFGSSGKTLFTVPGSFATPASILLRDDGSFYLAGSTLPDGENGSLALASFSAAGQPIASFGVGGALVTDVPAHSVGVYSALRQPDGRLVLGGTATSGGQDDALFVRFEADGTLDAGFGASGFSIIGTSTTDEYAYGLAWTSDGAIMAGGTISNASFQSYYIATKIQAGALLTAVNDLDASAELQVYPNPCTGTLLLSGGAIARATRITVLDLSGRVVRDLAPERAERMAQDASSLSPGVYLVSVRTASGLLQARFVKE